jgi:hypothetical protein
MVSRKEMIPTNVEIVHLLFSHSLHTLRMKPREAPDVVPGTLILGHYVEGSKGIV